jgi:signal transduction histidine kinase
MSRPRRVASFRALVVAVVVGGGILPLGLAGLWLARSAVRSGESLLSAELDQLLDRIATGIEQRWEVRRADLLMLANNAEVVNALLGPVDAPRDDSVRAYLAEVYETMRTRLPLVRISDRGGALRWELGDDVPIARRTGREAVAGIPSDPPLIVREPIVEDGRELGELVAQIRLGSLLPSDSAARQVANAAITVTSADGVTLYATPMDPELGDVVRVRRQLERPAVAIEVAAPSAAYVGPFQRTAMVGTGLLVVCAALSLLLTVLLARRLTRPLSELAVAADAVARGQLGQRVEPRGPDEVRRLSAGFNAMTESLQTTLESMARQKSLADVGEFAAQLAHEVRNALTPVRVNLQRAERRMAEAPGAALIAETLGHVEHLDRIVTGALHVARSGSVRATPVDLSAVLCNSGRAVAGELERLQVRLAPPASPSGVRVNGDASALQLLFTNLLLNAGEASPPGGVVEIAMRAEDGHAIVEVRDQGAGIPDDQLERALEPLYSTKPGGTGLGLPIARQIARAHGGTLTLENGLTAGLVSRVRLPLAQAERAARE